MRNAHTSQNIRTSQNARSLRGAHTARAAHTLVLVDIENMVGDPAASEEEYRTVFTFIRQFAINLCPRTRTIVASSHHAAASAWFAVDGSPVQRLTRSGPDGADLALLEAIPATEIAARYRHVVLCSGDHIFSPFVRELRNLGVTVTLVIGRGRPAQTLLRVCPSRVWLRLPSPTQQLRASHKNTQALAA